MNLKLILVVFILLCGKLWAIVPENKIVENHLIISFKNTCTSDEANFINQLNIESLKFLNVNKTLAILKFNQNSTIKNALISKLKTLSNITSIENDYRISLRTSTPNDPLIANQWHLNKISALKSWNLNRKGVTRRGDTIVIAVIDDGMNINHPDFRNNIWQNNGEIPENMIDDDSNGYVDDFMGWNFMGKNNDISDSANYKGKHGVPVAGIIGANGNNAEGVSGIMWFVKLMIVTIADTSRKPVIFQSDALQAYSYVLHQKKLFLESDGLLGANVIATNSSWGLDGVFPNNTPLWCAMYDSLGKYGVLNISAVTNAQVRVEIFGDIPTLCNSKHLIAVGSSTAGDNYFNCGYSDTYVDISAPGANIYSTAANLKNNVNAYYNNGFSGTSYAAPMVTGAAGLIHAYGCEKYLTLYETNPEKAMLILKRCILEGADILPNFLGKNATSGRLNIEKSMKIMDKFCYDELGINDFNTAIKFFVSPNPGNGSFQIFNLDNHLIENMKIYNALGQEIKFNLTENGFEINNPISGIFIISFISNKEIIRIKYQIN